MKVFFIDPQSYRNLAMYDCSLLENINAEYISYLCSKEYDYNNIYNENVVINKIFNYTNKKGIQKICSYINTLIAIFLLVIKDKPNLIHIQWLKIPIIDLMFALFIKLYSPNVKLIYTAHNIFPHNTMLGDKYIFKLYYGIVDKIICHSIVTKNELRNTTGVDNNKLVVINHGLLKHCADEMLVKQYIKYNLITYNIKRKIVFSMLGNIDRYKGVDIMINAWKNVMSMNINSNLYLLIVGRNNLPGTNIFIKVKNMSIVEKDVTNEEFIAFMRITDILVMPYINISQSGVLLTALNEEVPYMASNVGGLLDPLKIGNVGWDIGTPTVENVTNCIINIIKSKEWKSKKNDINEWNKIKEHYSWVDIGRLTNELYASTVGS